MSYQFPPELDHLVKRQLARGQYDSEDAVLIAAMQSLEQQQEELAAIREGIEDMNEGRVQSLRDFDREFREKKGIPQDA
jgi:Arc/MetJ-type ribon-helix-helix transcriptional regulator